MKTSKIKSLAATTAAASLGLALLSAPAAAAAPAAPTAPTAAPLPELDLKKNCPELPARAENPADWECIVMVVAGGSMQLGGLTQQITEPMKIIVQAGPPEGGGPNELVQVRMDAPPMKIPGGVLGMIGLPTIPGLDDVPGFKVEVASEYMGGFELELPNANVAMRIRIVNLLLGDSCYIGSEEDPLDFSMVADMSTLKLVSPQDPADPLGSPLILSVTAADNTFDVPASDCGIWSPLIDWQAGLPSASGNNSATFESYLVLGRYAPRAGAASTAADVRSLNLG